MVNQALHLISSQKLINKQRYIHGPLSIGLVALVFLTYQLVFAGDETFLTIGLFFLAIIINWLIMTIIVVPITKNDILINDKGITCSKINKQGYEGFVSWSAIDSLDIKYGHRSPTLLFDIYLKQGSNNDKESKIRLRINFIEQSDQDIKAYIKTLELVKLL